MSGPWAEGPAGPECVLCQLDRHLRGTPPLGPPVRLIEIEGVPGRQPVCAAHLEAWETLDRPSDALPEEDGPSGCPYGPPVP